MGDERPHVLAGTDAWTATTGRARTMLALLALAVLASCGSGRERLVVAAVRQPATALFFVAKDSGCFERERLEVEEHTFELGRDALALLTGNGADVAIAYETPTVHAAFADARLRVLTTLHTSTRNTRLVARRDRAITGLAALGGARIGLDEGSNADFFLDVVLRSGGVPRWRVRVEDRSPDASVTGLAAGELDAAVLSDPYAARAEHVLGAEARVFQSELYTELSLLLTRDDVLRARDEGLRRLLRGLACAERAARERSEETLGGLRARFPELRESDLRAQLARVRWGLGLDNVLLGALEDESLWLRDTGEVKGAPPDLQRLLVRRLLEDVAPEAVMLLPSRRAAP